MTGKTLDPSNLSPGDVVTHRSGDAYMVAGHDGAGHLVAVAPIALCSPPEWHPGKADPAEVAKNPVWRDLAARLSIVLLLLALATSAYGQAQWAPADLQAINSPATGKCSCYDPTTTAFSWLTVPTIPVDLTSEVTGLLPAANGGTNKDTSSDTGAPQISSGTWSVEPIGKGELYLKELDGGTGDHTFGGTSFEKITAFVTAGQAEGIVSVSAANDEITISTGDICEVGFTIGFSGTANRTIQCCVFAGVDASEVETHVCIPRTLGTGGSAGAAGYFGGLLSLSADDRLELWCKTDNNTPATTLDFWQLSLIADCGD